MHKTCLSNGPKGLFQIQRPAIPLVGLSGHSTRAFGIMINSNVKTSVSELHINTFLQPCGGNTGTPGWLAVTASAAFLAERYPYPEAQDPKKIFAEFASDDGINGT